MIMRIVLAGIALALSSGCGGGGGKGPQLLPATGTVSYKNSPLANVNVTFLPETGPAATGKTDAEGKFALATNGRSGAVAGSHKVTVSSVAIPPMPGTAEAKSLAAPSFPAKYGDPAKSGLKASVAQGGPPIEIKLAE